MICYIEIYHEENFNTNIYTRKKSNLDFIFFKSGGFYLDLKKDYG